MTPLKAYDPTASLKESSETIQVPIEVRGQRFGSLVLSREKEQGSWSQAEIDLVMETTTQIALALENARLLEEIQNRANQEELINQIVSQSQSSPNLETVMKIAVQEIGRNFSISKVQIRLSESGQKKQDGNGKIHSHGGQVSE